MALRLSDDQIIGLMDYIHKSDQSICGVLTHGEFKEMLKAQDYGYVVEAISQQTNDYEQSGSINVLEFLKATLSARGHILDDLYTEEFRCSEDDSGYVGKEQLLEMLQSTGAAVGVDDIFGEAGLDSSEDYIDFEEFLKVFRKMHTKVVCSRIKADLVSMTSAVSGEPRVANQDGISLSIHSRFEMTKRLGGSDSTVLEVEPRGVLDVEVSRASKVFRSMMSMGDIAPSRRSLRTASSLSFAPDNGYALKVFRLSKYTPTIARKVASELMKEIQALQKLNHPNIAKVRRSVRKGGHQCD